MLNRNEVCCFLLTVVLAGPSLSADEGWYSSYEEAKAQAEQSGVPLLLHFYAPWCGPCRQMKQQVFSQPAVRTELRRGIAAAEIDITKRQDLVAEYAVGTIPRDVIVYPGKAPETVAVGFKSSTAYLALLRKAAAVTAIPKSQQIASTAGDTETENQRLIGLEGFCPVRLIRDREWVTGDESVSETYRGITYYFSSEKERETFRKDSHRYTPQNLGCDPIVLYKDQKAITGKIKYGAFFDSRLFLFQSAGHRQQFKDNPLRYARIRHAVRADDLIGQRYH